LQKISELQKLLSANKFIIAPIGITYDIDNNYNGFSMSKAEGLPMCKFFTNTFHKNNKITNDNILQIIENFQKIVEFIHKNNCLVVDVNEFNFLIKEKSFEVFAIDVNSYQTPNFPATAIMENIRDYHSKNFNQFSDWYSFAILICQLLIGIHPFDGSNSKYKDNNNCIQRMKDNVSIFNKYSKIPKATRDLQNIPKEYLEWFIKLFENGERLLPPGNITKTQIQIITKSPIIIIGKIFNIENLKTFNSEILNYFNFQNNEIIVTKNIVHLNFPQQKEILQNFKNFVVYNNVNAVYNNNGKIAIKDLITDKIITSNFNYNEVKIVNNKILTIQNDKLIQIFNFNNILTADNSWDIVQNIKLFENCWFQDLLNNPYFYIPYNKNNKTCMGIFNLKELQNHKIIDAKFENRILVVITFKNVYNKFIFRINENYNTCNLIINFNDIKLKEINFSVLNSGTGISIEDQGILMFNNNISDTKILQDDLPDNSYLCTNHSNILFYNDKTIYKLTMKT